jgi:hypothetical protein
MKRFAILMGCGCALALAACTSQEDQMENNIRANLASQGNVTQVEMTRQDENSMAGFAVVNVNGTDTRRNCTATRNPSKGAAYYDWRCVRAVDESALNEMEATIRQSYIARPGVQVDSVDMTRRDDDHMVGHAALSDSYGNHARLDCIADRGSAGDFSWSCQEAGQGAAAPAAAAEPAGGSGPEPAGEGDK